MRRAPAGTVSPSAQRIDRMRPVTVAFSVWMSFMASICRSGAPFSTLSPGATYSLDTTP